MFKDWTSKSGYDDKGWNLTNSLAIWTPPGLDPPWDKNTYPNKEIYFNEGISWYVDLDPLTDESFSGYDLLTIAKHEIGHALGIKGDWGNTNVWTTPPPGTSSDEAMWGVFDTGQRNRLKPSDIRALRDLGKYHVVPEPGTVLLVGTGLVAFVAKKRRSSGRDGLEV